MIQIKHVTLKNFLSIGQATQSVNFDSKDLTLILGENLDLGGDGARNGTGKTSLIQALCYGLFGQPINNIRKDNLINRTNGKAMLVTVDFSVGKKNYRIERGRKPNILRFYVDNEQQKTQDDAQGENKETQAAIEKILCMSPDLFRHIVALNTYSEPFLAMKTNDQRMISEQLLGVTLLSEKAENLKTLIKETKDSIQSEEFRIKAIAEANKRVSEQIESLKRREKLWIAKHNEDLNKLITEYDELSKIDIVTELQAHKDLMVWVDAKKHNDDYESLLARQSAWKQKQQTDIQTLEKKLAKLNNVDILSELKAHKELALYNQLVKDAANQATEKKRIIKDLEKAKSQVTKFTEEVQTLLDHKCYACGQEFHDASHTEVLAKKQQSLAEAESDATQLQSKLSELNNSEIVVGEKPETHYKLESEAFQHSGLIQQVEGQIRDKKNEIDPYAEQISEMTLIELGEKPKTHYTTEAEAVKHSSRVDTLGSEILKKTEESDPYSEQISEMEQNAIQEVNFDTINDLNAKLDHQKFILDLLTSKDSFVRKKIIDQNLSYLNRRLTHYLDKMGLPHQVVFKNDLSVEITELGRDLDFHNLSRGEMSRVILSLSWAFLDVWECLYQPINLLLIDELLDGGMDSIGVENAMSILKEMNRGRKKSVWLISHREELVSRVGSVLKVVKENGFSTYQSDET
jgi:DNA repair exonuclease SbcCD ATPase subunit